MIVADDFVFVHQSKTGGTFVREALWEVSRRAERRFARGFFQRLGLIRPRYAYGETELQRIRHDRRADRRRAAPPRLLHDPIRRFSFQDPKSVYPKIDDAYLRERRWTRDMFDAHFMRTHSLNRDLHEYLANIGYPKALLGGLTDKRRVRPVEQLNERPSRKYEHYYDDETRALVLEKEKLLFAMFPDLLGPARGNTD